jgi:hypothetical protein
MQWSDLLVALALMLVLEGVLPFLNPTRARLAFEGMARLDDRGLRVAGLLSMAGGLLLLFFVRS